MGPWPVILTVQHTGQGPMLRLVGQALSRWSVDKKGTGTERVTILEGFLTNDSSEPVPFLSTTPPGGAPFRTLLLDSSC